MTSYSTDNLQWISSTAPKSQSSLSAHVPESSHTIGSSTENSSPFFVSQTIFTYRRLQPFSISYFTSSPSSINLGFLILPVVFTSSAAASKLFPAVLSPHHSTTLKKTIADSNPMPTVNTNGY